MESTAATHVATQFGKKFLFFPSLSNLAGADQDGKRLECGYKVR